MKQESVAVIALLTIGAISMLFVIWTILFRLSDHLVSKAYRSMLMAKVLRFLMCSAGIVLLIWPAPPRWGRVIALSWFSILSLGCIFSAIGWYFYAKDSIAMAKALKTHNVIEDLPVRTILKANGHNEVDTKNGK